MTERGWHIWSAGQDRNPTRRVHVWKQENSLDYTLNHFELIHGSDKERVRADMLHGKSGHFIFDLKGVQWYCHYNPVGYGGWYIFTMLRHDVGQPMPRRLHRDLRLHQV